MFSTWKAVASRGRDDMTMSRSSLRIRFTQSMVAVASVVQVSRLNAGTNSLGTSMELYVIAAAVIGGVALSGGSGTVLGSVLGALIVQFLESGLLLLDVSIGYRMVIIGQVLIVAVVFDVLYRRASGERTT